MKLKALLNTLVTAAAAAAGFFLRNHSLQNSLDSTGLPTEASAAIPLMWAFSALAVLVVLLTCLGRRELCGSYTQHMGTSSLLFLVFSLAAGFVCLASGAVWLRDYIFAGEDTMELIMPLLVLLTGVSWMALSVSAFRGREVAGQALFAFIPALSFCILLIYSYREISGIPSAFIFAFRILAPAAAALAFYYSAGFVYGRPRPRITLFVMRLAALFSAVTLADGHGFAKSLLWAFVIMAMLTGSFCLELTAPRRRGRHEL